MDEFLLPILEKRYFVAIPLDSLDRYLFYLDNKIDVLLKELNQLGNRANNPDFYFSNPEKWREFNDIYNKRFNELLPLITEYDEIVRGSQRM